MNSLSWMLYWAGVCESVGGTVGFLSFMLVFGSLACAFAYFVSGSFPDDNDAVSANKMAARALRWIAPLLVLVTLIDFFTPSKDTVYAIAASEFGETVAKSPEAAKARIALNAWLDKQIGEQKPEKDK